MVGKTNHLTCDQGPDDAYTLGVRGPAGGAGGGAGGVRRPGGAGGSELEDGGGQQTLQSPDQPEPAAAAPGSSQVNFHSSSNPSIGI